MPMLTSQDNEVVYLVPWSHLQNPPKEGGKPQPQTAKTTSLLSVTSRVYVNIRCVSGVYELVSFQMRPGGPAVWGKDFQAAATAHDAPGYGKLLGVFHSEFGLLNRGIP